jgi:hypothetical protein
MTEIVTRDAFKSLLFQRLLGFVGQGLRRNLEDFTERSQRKWQTFLRDQKMRMICPSTIVADVEPDEFDNFFL